MFLEVTDPRQGSNDWSCFVSHRLTVVNQKAEDRAVAKESQNRYSRAAKDWGWREFVTLTSLFDQDAGFLVHDTVVFSAEVGVGFNFQEMPSCSLEERNGCVGCCRAQHQSALQGPLLACLAPWCHPARAPPRLRGCNGSTLSRRAA